MHKIFSLAVLGILATSCVSNSSYVSLKEQYDSLAILNQRIESDFYHTDSLVASVLSNFQEISHIENMINVNLRPSESPVSEQQRIRDNMRLIYEKLDHSRDVINNLAAQLEAGGSENARLVSTLDILRLQLQQQRAHVELFEQEVYDRTSTLQSLDKRIGLLRQEAARIRRDQELYAELLDTRERAQNQVHYCIGTNRDLREMGIVRDKSIDVQSGRLDYLTKIDQRELHTLPLNARNARILSIHPKSAYALREDEGKQLVLHITAPEEFWSYSRVLVIEVY